MRTLAVALIALAASLAPDRARAAAPEDLVTAPDAILCMQAANLNEASQPEIARNQHRLRGLQCLRTEPGIPLTVIARPHASVWKVSFRPEGIPGGVPLWGRVTSFTTPDGEPLIHSTRAERR